MNATKIIKDVAAEDEPITLAVAKQHLKIVDIGGPHPDEALIQDRIRAARVWAEHYCKCAFAPRTLQYVMDAFPCDDYVEVETGPIEELVSVTYRDHTDASQVFNVAGLYLDDTGNRNRIYRVPGLAWPVTGPRRGSVRFEYTTAVYAPEPVRQAMLLMTEHLYRNRGVVVTGVIVSEIPLGIRALLDTAEVWSGAL